MGMLTVQSPSSMELLCIGDAIVDVFAAADPARLDELGIDEPSQHIGRDEARLLLEELRANPVANAVLCSGGAAANVAKVAAMLQIGTAFAGCVGNDDLASVFENDLRAAGVVPLLSAGTEATGLCLALNCNDETRIASAPGAALEFHEADVTEGMIAEAAALVLDGYMLDRRVLVQHVLELANRREIPVALDVASVSHIRENTEDILLYSRNYPLIVFMNADEAIVFYNAIKKNTAEIAASLEAISEHEKENLILKEVGPELKYITGRGNFPVIIIKLGSRGAVVLSGGDIHHEKTLAIIPRNTVGAGDAFCAAFMSAWIRGKPIRGCAALGNKVAREILLVPGTQVKAGKLRSFIRQLRQR